MKRLQGFVRWGVKPLVMLGIAGFVSLSLVLTTPATAQALAAPPISPPVIAGAIKTASPTIAKNLVNNLPGGFAVKALRSLAMLAFATTDLWVPYVTGNFGQPPAPGEKWLQTAWGPEWLRHKLDSYTRTGNAINASYSYPPGAQQDWYAKVGVLVKCKRESDGRIGYRSYGGTQGFGNDGNAGTFNWSWPDVCPGDTLIAWKVGGGQGTAAGQYSPNLDTSNPQAARLNEPTTQYDKASTNYVEAGDWTGSGSTPGGFDPRGADVKYQGRAECIDAQGTVTWIEGEIIPGDVGGVKMPSCEARGKGHGTGKTQIIAFKPDGTQQPVWDVPAAPMDPATPMCDPGRATSGCTLEITKDGQPCKSGDVECEDWIDTDAKDATKTRIKCKFGPYILPTAACGLLERAYRIGGAPATDENTDGDPGTSNNTDPNGNPIAPGTPTQPGTTLGTSPTTGTNPGSTPGEQGQNCWSSGWSWNPVSWVMVPVQCALQWAFVPPKTRIDTALGIIGPKLETRGIKPFVTPVLDGVSGLGGSGCTGPAIDLAAVKLPVFYPFSACTAPMSHIATGVSAFFSLAIVIQGGMSCIRGVASAFGFNWGLGSKTEESA